MAYKRLIVTCDGTWVVSMALLLLLGETHHLNMLAGQRQWLRERLVAPLEDGW